ALAELSASVLALSKAEQLPAHGRAVQIRLDIAAGGDGAPGGSS
ncbi:MAG: histidinol dehydrogenase, partial [Myxococcota bacterium]